MDIIALFWLVAIIYMLIHMMNMLQHMLNYQKRIIAVMDDVLLSFPQKTWLPANLLLQKYTANDREVAHALSELHYKRLILLRPRPPRPDSIAGREGLRIQDIRYGSFKVVKGAWRENGTDYLRC